MASSNVAIGHQKSLNPVQFLERSKGKNVIVKLKWGQEYKGVLLAYDDYFNFQVARVHHQLFNTEEWIDDQCKGNLGEVLIRCNNVVHIRIADDSELAQ